MTRGTPSCCSVHILVLGSWRPYRYRSITLEIQTATDMHKDTIQLNDFSSLKKKKIILVNQSYSVNRTGSWGPFPWCSSLMRVAVVTWGLRRGGTVVLQKKKPHKHK